MYLLLVSTGKICDVVQVLGKDVLSTSAIVTTCPVCHRYCFYSSLDHNSENIFLHRTSSSSTVAATNKGLNFSGHTMGTGGLCSRFGRPSAQECPEAHDAPQIYLQGCGCLFLMVENQEQLEFEVALFATTGK
jgi:hypothetical protein